MPEPDTMAEEFRDNISVVIVNYDRVASTIKSVDCIRRSSGDYVREVLVVDNGSSPEIVAELAEALEGKARLLELGINRYFGEGNNIGVEEATGEYILLLNNDAYVEPRCIEELVSTMQRRPDVAAVGPMFLYPSGAVQEVGSMVLETGEITQIGKGAVWDADHYTAECSVDYCSAACLLLRKRDFVRAGGFALQWEPAYFEDADLCLTLKKDVGPVIVNPRARVVHLESHTTADARMRLGAQVEINRISFVEKWGEWLRARQAFRGRDLIRPSAVDPHDGAAAGKLPATARGGTRIRSAVLYDPYDLIPGGGERYLFELGAAIAELIGPANVRMASTNRYSNLRMMQLCEVFGLSAPTSCITLEELEADPPDMTVVLGNEIAPPAPGHGRHFNVYMCQFPFAAPEAYIRTHGPNLRTFDEIWVNSEFTRRYVSGSLTLTGVHRPEVRVVPPASTIAAPPDLPPWGSRQAIMTVGRFFQGGHNKRQDVVIEITRGLNEALGRPVPLIMAGSLHANHSSRDRFQELSRMTEGIDCRIYPNVRRERLVELYASSAVLVHAAGFGVDKFDSPERLEHFGIVPVEAASLGCIPVVYGEGGPAEVMRAFDAPTTYHSVPEAVEKIAAIFADPEGSERLSRKLMDRSEQFSRNAFRRRVRDILAVPMGLTPDARSGAVAS